MTVRSLIPFIKHNDIRLVLEDDSEICLIRKEHIQKELLSDKCLDMKVVYIETDEEIPDNVIRIETQDGSGDFIEIIFPEENKDKNKNDK